MQGHNNGFQSLLWISFLHKFYRLLARPPAYRFINSHTEGTVPCLWPSQGGPSKPRCRAPKYFSIICQLLTWSKPNAFFQRGPCHHDDDKEYHPSRLLRSFVPFIREWTLQLLLEMQKEPKNRDTGEYMPTAWFLLGMQEIQAACRRWSPRLSWSMEQRQQRPQNVRKKNSFCTLHNL